MFERFGLLKGLFVHKKVKNIDWARCNCLYVNDIAICVHGKCLRPFFRSLSLLTPKSAHSLLDPFVFIAAGLSVWFHCPFKSFVDVRAMANYDPDHQTYGNIFISVVFLFDIRFNLFSLDFFLFFFEIHLLDGLAWALHLLYSCVRKETTNINTFHKSD